MRVLGYLLISWLGASVVMARIASWDMCADAWVLWLFDVDEIAATSSMSDHPLTHNGTVESLLKHQPRILIADSRLDASKKCLLEKRGIQVIVLPEMKSLRDVEQRLLFFQKTFEKRGSRGKKIQGALKALQQMMKSKERVRVGAYVSQGFLVAGPETLLSDILAHLGIHNPFEGLQGWAYLNLETILASKPEVLFYDGGPLHPYVEKAGVKKCPLSLKNTLCFLPNTFFNLKKEVDSCGYAS